MRAIDLKKPQSAFALYLSENKDIIKKEMKEKGVNHISFLSEASKMWNVISAEGKQKYVEMANKKKDHYLKSLAAIKEAGDQDEDDIDGEDPN